MPAMRRAIRSIRESWRADSSISNLPAVSSPWQPICSDPIGKPSAHDNVTGLVDRRTATLFNCHRAFTFSSDLDQAADGLGAADLLALH
jgi:hypothetical protein